MSANAPPKTTPTDRAATRRGGQRDAPPGRLGMVADVEVDSETIRTLHIVAVVVEYANMAVDE